jgi:hypothetical protein
VLADLEAAEREASGEVLGEMNAAGRALEELDAEPRLEPGDSARDSRRELFSRAAALAKPPVSATASRTFSSWNYPFYCFHNWNNNLHISRILSNALTAHHSARRR